MGGALWLGEPWEVRFFEKSFAQRCDEGAGKVGKKEGNGRQQGGWAFVSAKFIAGGIGTFWIEGNGKKPKEKIENEDLGVSGVLGGPVPHWSL